MIMLLIFFQKANEVCCDSSYGTHVFKELTKYTQLDWS